MYKVDPYCQGSISSKLPPSHPPTAWPARCDALPLGSRRTRPVRRSCGPRRAASGTPRHRRAPSARTTAACERDERVTCVLRAYCVRVSCVLRVKYVRTMCVLCAYWMRITYVLREHYRRTTGVRCACYVRTACVLVAHYERIMCVPRSCYVRITYTNTSVINT